MESQIKAIKQTLDELAIISSQRKLTADEARQAKELARLLAELRRNEK